ncbi:hypothetical protein J891_0978 [Acinetobacter baumannii 44327_8]|nr:hypothetical protein BJAB0868_01190 [Acinetobacter baumannii BJAB0868]AGQ13617.1 hypothetical protein BJAB07104_01249 [Acinetobacter baumannii BJAB07104]EJG28453.1 hypothetical protein ACINNAV7_A3054 [Acinetobacter baumannii Naval-17]EKL44173.1 hypothetical protein ACIN5074_2143 [Acinetobacter baumannii OIFC074]EKP49572.1 hypothetical protein ACINNAV21_2059 [Acinetobacter baumannii Naval-21]ELX02016.1 hypothetical protein ACINNAV78_1878 [Acinetobacter baumannii Naval-78]EMT92070.1 hypothet
MAHYTGFKVKEGTKVDPYIFMPHETPPDDDEELSLEEYFEKYHSN